ncbi:hypothetical protein EG834_19225 [bacterium]|nr:hypothetical protein [bacterium]
MLKSADYFGTHNGNPEQVAKLRETGRRFLQDATKDESLKPNNRLDSYYFLHDWVALRAEATRNLNQAAADDSLTRAEMSNWIGISLAMQDTPDIEGAVAAFDKVIAENEKNPQVVKDRAVLATNWALSLRIRQNDKVKAREYLVKINSMPDCNMKTITLHDFQYLNAN